MSISYINLEVTADHAVPVAPLGGQSVVTVLAGATIYYADNPVVSSIANQGSITAGSPHTFTMPAWIVGTPGAGSTAVQIAQYAGTAGSPPGAQDIVLGSDGLVGGPGGTQLTASVPFTGQVASGGGQTNQLWVSVTGQNVEVSRGTYAQPYSTAQPPLKVEQYTSQTGSGREDQVGSIYGLAVADPTCGVQATGIIGVGIGSSNQSGNQDVCGVSGYARQMPLATLGGAGLPLSTGGPISVLPIVAGAAIPAGTYTLTYTDTSGVTHTQSWTTAGCAANVASLPVSSQTPTYAFPSGAALSTGSNGAARGGYFTARIEAGSSGRLYGVPVEAQNWDADDAGQPNGCHTVGVRISTAGAPYMVGTAIEIDGGPDDFNHSRADTCTFTNGSATIADMSITAADAGATVFAANGFQSGTLVLSTATIATVTPGTSFVLAGGVTALANGTVTARISSPYNGHPSAQFNYGFLATNLAPIKTATFWDDGYALNSIQVQGRHAGASIAVDNSAGVVIIGNAPFVDTGCTFNGTAVVADANAVSGYVDQAVAGPGIPAGTVIQSVVANTSFTMSNASTYAGAGSVVIGGQQNANLTSLAELQTATADALGALTVGNANVTAHQWSIDLLHGSGIGRIGIGGANQLASGASSGDLVIQPTVASTHVHLAGTSSVVKVTQDNKLGFFGVTAVAQPSAVGSATGYVAGTTTGTFHTDDKYTGNVGSTGYTINGLVAALKNLGALAQ